MTSAALLRPADPAEVADALADTLRYDPTWTPKFTFTFLFNYLGIGQ